jgi:Ca2+/Na+ antiporter
MSIQTAVRSYSFKAFCIFVFASIAIHLILRSDIQGSAFLYVGIPTIIAGLLLLTDSKQTDQHWKSKFSRLVRSSLFIMLASSAVLFEGFLCVVMFMPIYFGVILIIFIIKYAYEHNKSKSRLHLHMLPMLIVVASLEGIHPDLSFERYNEVTSSKVVNLSINQIKQNLVKPVELDQNRHWFLAMFPMPYEFDAKSLTEGEVHTIKYRYHRWFITNTHEGFTKIKVAEVSDQKVRMQIIEDTSYTSNYINAHGTEINLIPIDANTTEIRLTVKYERLLDPAWYFDPLQRYATGLLGEYLIGVMIERR